MALEPEKSKIVLLVSDRVFLLCPNRKRASQSQMEEAGQSGLITKLLYDAP